MRWADLRFMSGPSPRPLKEALGSDYASLAEKHAETRPREPPPRVFHVTGTFKDPKDAATVLSGSRQDGSRSFCRASWKTSCVLVSLLSSS
jgi:hypothetical protein